MKTVFLFCFFCLSTFLIGQNNSFEIYGSANHSGFTNAIIDFDKVLSVGFGVGYNYGINEKLQLTAGLRFADYVNEYSNDDLRWGTQHDGQGGFDSTIVDGEGISGLTFKHHYYFLEMPLGIKYYLIDKKAKLFLEPTLNPSLFLTHRTDINVRMNDSDDINEIDSGGYTDLRRINVFGEMGIGLQIPLFKNMDLQIRTSGRMQLMDAANNSATGAKLYSWAAKVGFVYLLKKN
ncbi:MAG: outer membrane beta-barrel protein [Bacteroidota bacterium]